MSSVEWHQNCPALRVCPVRRSWGSGARLHWKENFGDTLKPPSNPWQAFAKAKELGSHVPSYRTIDNGPKLKQEGFLLGIGVREKGTAKYQSTGRGCLEMSWCWAVYGLKGFQDPTWHIPAQPGLTSDIMLLWAAGWTMDIQIDLIN